MRHFIARVQGCGVIAECDAEFGKVLSPSIVANESVIPSVRVKPEKVSHLDERQRAELFAVLDEFAACFLDKPGLCDVVTHCIVTTPEFVPKQMKPYRVPVAFLSEVNRQTRKQLDMGLIHPFVSPMASPIVCVAKKSGGMRIACDYRYLNSFTVGYAYPMSTINETLRRSDSRGSYPTSTLRVDTVAEEDRWLTAFITHDGLYEWVRMPFRLKNAGATFVMAVRNVLQPTCDFSESYVNDIGVGSDD